MSDALSTTGINTSAIRTVQSAEVVRQAANLVKFSKFIGKPGDENAVIFNPLSKMEKGKYVEIPLRRVDNTDANSAGELLEQSGDVIPYSTSQITIAERVKVFQEPGLYEKMTTVIDTRKQITKDLADWEAAKLDQMLIEGIRVATPQATLPARSARRPATTTSRYLVEYLGNASDWNHITSDCGITGAGLSRAKRYFQKNGVRPAKFGGMSGYLLLLPIEACMDLQQDPEFQLKAKDTLPRSEDHPFWKGFGDEFFARYDGMWIFQDLRPAFGGSDTTFLYTDETGDFMKFEGIFMGAQGVAYYKQAGPNYFERLWNHNHNFEASVSTFDGVVKTVLNLGDINDTTNIREYGVGYVCGKATKIT